MTKRDPDPWMKMAPVVHPGCRSVMYVASEADITPREFDLMSPSELARFRSEQDLIRAWMATAGVEAAFRSFGRSVEEAGEALSQAFGAFGSGDESDLDVDSGVGQQNAQAVEPPTQEEVREALRPASSSRFRVAAGRAREEEG